MISRRNFFTKSSLSSLAVLAGAKSASALGINLANAQSKSTLPVVMAPRHDGCEIIWSVNSLAKGYVEYGISKDLGTKAENDGWGLRPSGENVIKVRISGLKTGTKYFYKVVTESFDTKNPAASESDIFTFTTLDPSTANCSFSVWNDTHKHNDTIEKLGQITQPCDFLMWNGDISNNWYSEADIPQTLLDTPADLSGGHPLFLLRGNHDLRGEHAGKLQHYCAMPEDKPWFAFRQGPVAFICLDTGEDKADDNDYLFGRVACEPMRREQAEWIAEITQLPAFRDAPYRVVFCHIPLRWKDETTVTSYDNFSKRSRDLWHDSLVKWGAQVIISGHIHEHALLPASLEFPYAQLVGGGPKIDNATLIEGKADNTQLDLICKDLQNRTLHNLALKPTPKR